MASYLRPCLRCGQQVRSMLPAPRGLCEACQVDILTDVPVVEEDPKPRKDAKK